jgi:hypothetical protein
MRTERFHLSLTSVLNEGKWSVLLNSCFIPRKELPVPNDRMGGAQNWHFVSEKSMEFMKKLISWPMAVALALAIKRG